jgi:hypothetical protein
MHLRLLSLTLLLHLGATADATPRFADFPATEPANATPAPLVLEKKDQLFRTRLRAAAKQRPNFAGHFVLTGWGCGAECVMGAAIDVNTGRVIALPGTVSGWFLDGRTERDWGYRAPDAFEPITFRLDSRLLVLRGQLDEQGPVARHAFELRGDRLVRVDTAPVPGHPAR